MFLVNFYNINVKPLTLSFSNCDLHKRFYSKFVEIAEKNLKFNNTNPYKALAGRLKSGIHKFSLAVRQCIQRIINFFSSFHLFKKSTLIQKNDIKNVQTPVQLASIEEIITARNNNHRATIETKSVEKREVPVTRQQQTTVSKANVATPSSKALDWGVVAKPEPQIASKQIEEAIAKREKLEGTVVIKVQKQPVATQNETAINKREKLEEAIVIKTDSQPIDKTDVVAIDTKEKSEESVATETDLQPADKTNKTDLTKKEKIESLKNRLQRTPLNAEQIRKKELVERQQLLKKCVFNFVKVFLNTKDSKQPPLMKMLFARVESMPGQMLSKLGRANIENLALDAYIYAHIKREQQIFKVKRDYFDIEHYIPSLIEKIELDFPDLILDEKIELDFTDLILDGKKNLKNKIRYLMEGLNRQKNLEDRSMVRYLSKSDKILA